MSNLTQETKFSKLDFTVADVNKQNNGFGMPQYNYSRIPPSVTASQSLSTNDVFDAEFKIPTTAFNPAKSYISYDVKTWDCTTNTNLISTSCDASPLVETIDLRTESGTPIINKLSNIRELQKVMNPRQTSMKEYLQADNSNAANYAPSWLTAGTSTTTNSQFTTTGALTTTATVTDYYENKHALFGTDSKAQTYTGLCLPFSSLKNTFLAVDKTILMPENLYLTVNFGQSARTFTPHVIATKALAPATEAEMSQATAKATLSNITLYLCVDENQDNVKLLQAQEAKEGIRLHIPVVETSFKNITANADGSDSLEINRTKGYRLRKIFLSPFTHGANGGAWLDNSNFSGQKIASYWTQFNNKRIENYNIDVTSKVDFKQYRLKHPSSDDAFLNSNHYYYNWAICSEFDGGLPLNCNLSGGIDLENMQYTFDLMGNFAANFYLGRFVIYEKDMLITSQGIKF